MCRFSGHKEKWGEFLDVKVNFADVLARQLSGRRTRPAGKVTIGSVTDAYQPAEERYGITRASLQVLAEYQLLEVGVLTKSHLVERDIPILRGLPACEVGFTLTTLDGDVAGVLEPGASPPKARLAAAGALIKAGIPVWVFVAPLLPGLTDAERSLTALFQSLRETGVKEILFDHLNPYPAVANRMKTAYRRYFPTALPALEEYLRHPGGYWDEIGALLRSAAAPSKSRAAMDDQ
jgi:DNA repair photolyase